MPSSPLRAHQLLDRWLSVVQGMAFMAWPLPSRFTTSCFHLLCDATWWDDMHVVYPNSANITVASMRVCIARFGSVFFCLFYAVWQRNMSKALRMLCGRIFVWCCICSLDNLTVDEPLLKVNWLISGLLNVSICNSTYTAGNAIAEVDCCSCKTTLMLHCQFCIDKWQLLLDG